MKSLPLSVFVCLSSVSPPPRNPASLLYPSLAPFITTPCTRVMMQFVGKRAVALHCYWGSTAGCFLQAQSSLQTRLQLNGEFPLCASCISRTDFGVIFKAFVFVLHSVHNPSPVCSSHLCLTKVWIDYAVLDFSSGSVCALSWISHCLTHSYSTGLSCFGRSDCVIRCWSSAVLWASHKQKCRYETVYWVLAVTHSLQFNSWTK